MKGDLFFFTISLTLTKGQRRNNCTAAFLFLPTGGERQEKNTGNGVGEGGFEERCFV